MINPGMSYGASIARASTALSGALPKSRRWSRDGSRSRAPPLTRRRYYRGRLLRSRVHPLLGQIFADNDFPLPSLRVRCVPNEQPRAAAFPSRHCRRCILHLCVRRTARTRVVETFPRRTDNYRLYKLYESRNSRRGSDDVSLIWPIRLYDARVQYICRFRSYMFRCSFYVHRAENVITE